MVYQENLDLMLDHDVPLGFANIPFVRISPTKVKSNYVFFFLHNKPKWNN